MKISLNWIKEFTDISLSTDELVDKIGAQLGAVESVVDLSKKYQGIVVVRVVECIKHPDADKLSLCRVDDGQKVQNVERGEDGLVQVVCGALNGQVKVDKNKFVLFRHRALFQFLRSQHPAQQLPP